MVPLIILLGSFGIFVLINKFLLSNRFALSFMGRLSMALVLLTVGITHFTNTADMVKMMPEILPAKTEFVYFTGVCELVAVIGLLSNKLSRPTSIMLIIFFIAILPANIVGSLNRVEIGGMVYGPIYLLFRIPLQILFIYWVYLFGIKTVDAENR